MAMERAKMRAREFCLTSMPVTMGGWFGARAVTQGHLVAWLGLTNENPKSSCLGSEKRKPLPLQSSHVKESLGLKILQFCWIFAGVGILSASSISRSMAALTTMNGYPSTNSMKFSMASSEGFRLKALKSLPIAAFTLRSVNINSPLWISSS